MCVNMNDLCSFHRHNVGQGGVSLCRGSWAGSGLRAARAASHGSHHRRLPGRVCPQDLGDVAEKERRLGKKCCLIRLVSVCPDQKIPVNESESALPEALCRKRLCEILFHSAVATSVLLTPVLDLDNSVTASWSHPQKHQLFLSSASCIAEP